jgi:hypothetical protein
MPTAMQGIRNTLQRLTVGLRVARSTPLVFQKDPLIVFFGWSGHCLLVSLSTQNRHVIRARRYGLTSERDDVIRFD